MTQLGTIVFMLTYALPRWELFSVRSLLFLDTFMRVTSFNSLFYLHEFTIRLRRVPLSLSFRPGNPPKRFLGILIIVRRTVQSSSSVLLNPLLLSTR